MTEQPQIAINQRDIYLFQILSLFPSGSFNLRFGGSLEESWLIADAASDSIAWDLWEKEPQIREIGYKLLVKRQGRAFAQSIPERKRPDSRHNGGCSSPSSIMTTTQASKLVDPEIIIADCVRYNRSDWLRQNEFLTRYFFDQQATHVIHSADSVTDFEILAVVPATTPLRLAGGSIEGAIGRRCADMPPEIGEFKRWLVQKVLSAGRASGSYSMVWGDETIPEIEWKFDVEGYYITGHDQVMCVTHDLKKDKEWAAFQQRLWRDKVESLK